MSQRVLRVATISLWGLLLLARCNLVLANAPTNPCYYHIDAAYDCSMYYQFSNPFCFCPGQQTTRCKPVQQGYMKLHLTMENITHPWMDTAIRTLRLETSKKGGPIPLTIPAHQEVARETSMPLFPKNWVTCFLRGDVRLLEQGKGVQNSSG